MDNNVKQIFDIMNAKEHKNANYIYRVPLYQRGYRWGIGQVVSLFDDIHRNSMKYSDNLKESERGATGYEYCIQPLVLKKDMEKQYIVIDGQQRLTTLSLIFQALNRLESDLNDISNLEDKKDNIMIIYDRAESGNINDISKKCSLILSKMEIPYSDIKSIQTYKSRIKEYEDDINQLINEQDNIDYQFMIINYIYIYLFLKSIVRDGETPCEYLSYLNMETRKNVDYGKQRLEQLRKVFKYELSVIWYEPENKDEEGTFEKFNASKIPLTQSELVKALFMNPDNYIVPGSSDYSNEAIKVRQVSIGVEWDKIERSLNQADLWFFIPHSEKHNNSKFDALVDLFVFYKMLDDDNSKAEWEKNIDDDYYAYNKLEEWTRAELDKAASSEEKTNIMEYWWREFTDLYEWYYDIYESVTYEPKTEETKISYSIYHRISLLQLIQEYYFTKITNGNKTEKYIDAIKKNHEIYVSLNQVCSSQFKKKLNEMILKRVDAIWGTNNPITCFRNKDDKTKADTLEKKIKALQYHSNNILMRIFQVIFSLEILEETVGSFSRFSFREFSKKKSNGDESWVLEHIFAKGTNLVNYAQKEKIISLLKDSGWQEYLEYKYKDILEDDLIKKMIDAKKMVIDKIDEYCQNKKQMPERIWKVTDSYEADYEEVPDDIFDAMIVNFLKDNSMGNMSILQYDDNSGVGNKLYLEKQNLVREYASKGKFIPIGTLNVFNGVYLDKNFEMDIWYPIHRKMYLETMIEKISDYLAID